VVRAAPMEPGLVQSASDEPTTATYTVDDEQGADLADRRGAPRSAGI